MSSEQDQARQLAERIARRVAASKQQQPASHSSDAGELNDELAELRQSLAGLQQRLAQIESHLAPPDRTPNDRPNPPATYQQATGTQTANADAAPATRSPWLSGMYVPATHPSQEKFGVEEATVAELVDFFEGTKTCELEPGGKPCDHCAMCSSRGF
jgi:hypothetical protein